MTTVSFRVLGPVSASVDDEVVRLGGPRQHSVLALLLLSRGRVLTADQVVDALWDEPPKTARNSVQRFVADIRRSHHELGQRLESTGGGYRFEVADDELDLSRFEERLETARSLHSQGDTPAESRVLREGLAEWQGDALAAIGDPPYADLERARLTEMQLGAIERSIDAELATGRHADLVPELERLVESHQFRERLWGQLLVALYRSGRQADALATFGRLKELLLDELGVDPTPELRAMELQILNQEPELDASTNATTTEASTPSDHIVRGYELGDLIGSGDHNRVHLARQLSTGREVAVKVFEAAQADDPPFIRAFDNSNSGVASLEHPHIVPLYDWWREPAAAYVVMRLLRGGNFENVVVDADDATRRRALTQVAEALRAAHQRGIRHGAVEAGNVLLDHEGNAYLSDFGITRTATAEKDLADFVQLVESALPGELSSASYDNIDDVLRALFVPSSARSDSDNPYKGLRAFQESDAEHFFGRDRLVSKLIDRVDRGRFLAVVGSSGSGKSSAVRAGLVPRLRAGAIEGSAEWFVVDMIPGAAPLDELARAIRRVAVDPPDDLRDMLMSGADGLRKAVDLVLPVEGAEMLLIVDQFEELFTLVTSDRARQRFVDALVAAVTDPRSRLRIVVTMRADFYDRPLETPGLGELFQSSSETVIPLSGEEIERAIVGPAERVGVGFEPALVAQIVSEVADQPAALPLMQYALTELFDVRTANVIDLDDYAEVGGVHGALARRADRLYAQLPGGDQLALRQVLLRLVTVGDEARGDTRRRVPRAELEGAADSAVVERVLNEFGRHRLLTFDRDVHTGTPTVEVAHEALLREWARLRDWIETSRDDVRQHRRVTTDAAEWDDAGRDPSFLPTGSRLDGVLLWRENTDLTLTDQEAAFVAASVGARRDTEKSDRERLEREADLERRSNRRLRTLVGVLAAAALVAVALSAFAFDRSREASRQQSAAEIQALRATTQGLASTALAELDIDPELSLLLALEAVDISRAAGEQPPNDAVEALHKGLDQSRLTRRLSEGVIADYSDAGDLIVTGTTDGSVIIHRNTDLTESVRIESAHVGSITALDFTADGSRLVTGGDDGAVRVWDVASGLLLATALRDQPEASVSSVEMSPGDDRILIGARSGAVTISDANTGAELATRVVSDPGAASPTMAGWISEEVVAYLATTGVTTPVLADARTLRPLESQATFTGGCGAFAISSQGALLTSGDTQVAFVVGAGTDGQRVDLEGHSSRVCVADFSADGSRMATGSLDSTIRVWSGDRTDLILAGHTSIILSVAFNAAGDRLLSASSSGEIFEWTIETDRVKERTVIAGDTPDVAFARDDSSLIVTIGASGVRTHDASTGELVEEVLTNISATFVQHPMAMTPDRNRMLIPSPLAGGVDIWTVAPLALERQLFASTEQLAIVRIDAAGESVAATGVDGSVHLWSMTDDTLRWSTDASADLIFNVDMRFTLDGRRLAVSRADGIEILDVETGDRLDLWPASAQTTIATGPPGRMFSGGFDGEIFEWDTATGSVLQVFTGRSAPENIAYDASSGHLIIGELSGTVSIWDVEDGERLFSLELHDTTVVGMDLDPAGSWVASSDPENVHIWALGLDELTGLAKQRITRSITQAECAAYAGLESCSER